MIIDFSPILYKFIKKPLLFAGKAMEYYQLRPAGNDIDVIVTHADFENLKNLYPNNVRLIDKDYGITLTNFEFWDTAFNYDYDFLIDDSIEEQNYRVVSVGKLLLLKKSAKPTEKNLNDIVLLEKKLK